MFCRVLKVCLFLICLGTFVLAVALSLRFKNENNQGGKIKLQCTISTKFGQAIFMDSQCLMFTSESKKDVDLCMTNVYFLFVFFSNVLLHSNI